mmetsp:Transcript_12382/g.40763  ORF Transcript_12382/g.40763 Transcript_12382/m.40763 type:complete len:240 (-) Transcript_12382:795-1514(-)
MRDEKVMLVSAMPKDVSHFASVAVLPQLSHEQHDESPGHDENRPANPRPDGDPVVCRDHPQPEHRKHAPDDVEHRDGRLELPLPSSLCRLHFLVFGFSILLRLFGRLLLFLRHLLYTHQPSPEQVRAGKEAEEEVKVDKSDAHGAREERSPNERLARVDRHCARDERADAVHLHEKDDENFGQDLLADEARGFGPVEERRLRPDLLYEAVHAREHERSEKSQHTREGVECREGARRARE